EAAYDPAAQRLLRPFSRPLTALQTPGRWEARAPLPSSRSEVAAAEVGGKVYVVGGLVESGVTGALEAYDPAIDAWQVLAPLPEPAHHPSAGSLDGKLYVFGGYTGDWAPSRRAWEYDPGANAWRELPPMPTARGALVSAAVGDKLYAIGGAAADNV